jgi:hypothetical protein
MTTKTQVKKPKNKDTKRKTKAVLKKPEFVYEFMWDKETDTLSYKAVPYINIKKLSFDNSLRYCESEVCAKWEVHCSNLKLTSEELLLINIFGDDSEEYKNFKAECDRA